MSSPPNRAYHSKLLAFLNRQYIKVKDSSSKSWRGLKLTVTWGIQILLYPVYLLAQTGRLIGHQVQQRVKLLQSQDQTSSTQSVVETTLTTLETWFPLEIQAVATDIHSQKLVLVQANNELLDILDEQQQQELKKIIIKNLANYWYKQRENKQIILAKKFPNRLAAINANNTNIITPIRGFWQTMAWIQNSPVATEVNLFGEAYLEREDSFQALQDLIARAIDYFFGSHRTSQEIGENKSELPRIQKVTERAIAYLLDQTSKELSASQTTQDESKQWLSWEDLFNEEKPTFFEYVPVIKEQKEAIAPKRELPKLEEDYLETKVTSLGYVESPIEKLIRRLDQIMVWVENLCLNIWDFLFKKR
ncbi:hypothetical protein [Gloeocapsa sp. PCC 73106]|uniref:hypothetical protein n=1 Tax=Gloeocapsa sp. PCC 73106 TaxID=102232 RepID=UPI0002ACF6C5|nr:hypothetical protein [Gloeocapsa sp. PCC 73106]ELR98854.1 hypothetical protein GLO73106DRAFT_00026920 [Gloeocapsa sp. PCC 73106]